MSQPIIEVRDISKLYRLGEIGATTIRESVERLFHRLGLSRNGYGSPPTASSKSSNPRQAGPEPNTFWALKDVSFDVQQGEIIGILGRNGAGKSTLLKILSRLTEPTTGRAVLRGRLASLLEVGTGFHPELSGRENVYLNGAMLGMRKSEIKRKFDEIIAFAEIEQFIDTPVKRYSSGMYVRLAFAVAAHLEPEILIIDEVLAVGDAEFQRKCLGKMQDVSRSQGRTVLFVSHNIDAVRRLCSRCVFVDHGRLIACNDKNDAIARYLASDVSKAAPRSWIDVSQARRVGTGEARFSAVRFSSLSSEAAFQPYPNGPLEVTFTIDSRDERIVRSIGFTLLDQSGTKLVNADTGQKGLITKLRAGSNEVTMRIDQLHLKPGNYLASLWMANFVVAGENDILDFAECAFELEVLSLEKEGMQTRIGYDGVVPCEFEVLGDS
jgi:lipopolysaccharide transport system ATP-binding protein